MTALCYSFCSIHLLINYYLLIVIAISFKCSEYYNRDERISTVYKSSFPCILYSGKIINHNIYSNVAIYHQCRVRATRFNLEVFFLFFFSKLFALCHSILFGISTKIELQIKQNVVLGI